MASKTPPARRKDSEKITVNLGFVDLGKIDLLVAEGFYSSRTDVIRMAIRNHLAGHASVLDSAVSRNELALGLRHYNRADLEAAQARGERLCIRVVGLASIGADVSAQLARDTIASLHVLGALHASAGVKAALADRCL